MSDTSKGQQEDTTAVKAAEREKAVQELKKREAEGGNKMLNGPTENKGVNDNAEVNNKENN